MFHSSDNVNFKRLGLAMLALLLHWASMGQASQEVPKQFVSNQKIKLEHLSNSKVNVFHQDHLGFIWIGTDYGLNRFDGHQVQQFFFNDAGFPFNRITHILEDTQGLFWLIEAQPYIDTYLDVQQVIFFDPIHQVSLTEDQFFKQKKPFDWKEVQHFFQGKSGQLVFYTQNSTTWIYNQNGNFEVLMAPDNFYPIQASLNHGIWGQIENQVVELTQDGQQVRSFQVQDGEKCQLIIEGFNQDVYYKSHFLREKPILTAQEPINWKTGIGKPLPKALKNRLVGNKLLFKVDLKEKIYWVFTDHWIPYDDEGKVLVEPDQPLIFNRSIFLKDYLLDKEGSIWDNSAEGVFMQKLELDRFERYLDEPSPEENEPYRVRTLLPGTDQLLAGTYQGNQLVDFSTQKNQLWPIKDSEMARGTFHSITSLDDSTAWGTNHTLVKINTKKWTIDKSVLLPDTSLPGIDAKIWGTYLAQSGRWWMKKQPYLLYYDPEKSDTFQIFDQYNEFEELRHKLIFHFYENEQGIWLATYAGLFLLDEEQGILQQFSTKSTETDYLPVDRIHYIHPDTGSWFWLATADMGLVRWNYKTGNWSNLSRKDGLPSNNLYAILPDDHGFLWISSENGLIRLHPDRQTFDLFFEEQGLPSNEFNRMAYHQLKDGYLFFGTQNGMVRFQPGGFDHTDNYCPDLGVSMGMTYNGQGRLVRKIPANNERKQKIYLKADEKRIDLYFSLQNYFQSEKHQYEYRIVGKKDSWIKLNNNQLSLGGLNYGKNKFRVRAKKADGNIAENIMVLTIYQQAPFYLRWWFLLLCLLSLAGGIYYYISWRTKKYQKQQVFLEQEVQKRMEQIQKDQLIIEAQAAALQALDIDFIEQIDQLILQNLSNPDFSVEELAKASGLSRSQLHRKLKNAVQQTTSRRIREIRLKKAQELLRDRSHSIAEVAYQCGFQDANYFSRLFKQEFGISARTFREQT